MLPKRVAGLILVIALGAFTALALDTARDKSATFDEVKHVPAGYMFLRAGDYRLDLDNPPLARMIAALPLLASPVRVDTADPAWRESRPWWFGHRFLYEWNDADTLLHRSRGAITVVAIGLIVAIFLWSGTLFGPAAAALASVLAAFSPDLLAHGSLATTDLVLAAFFFATVLACERLFTEATPWRVAVTGIALGAALASKYSAAALLPILAVLALVEILADRPIPFAWGARRRPVLTAATRGQRARLAAALLGSILVVAGATIWGVYRFRDAPTPPGAVVRPLSWEAGDLHGGAAVPVVLAARSLGLLPEAYLHGFLDMLRSGEHHRAFLMGEIRTGGWWSFFPITFALKTPIPMLLLAAAGVLVSLGPAGRRRVDAYLLVPVAIYAGMAAAHGLSIGHRHLLPIDPFLFVAAGRLAAWPLARPAPRLVASMAAAAACLIALGTLRNHPDHLAYFNSFAGGPEGGYRYLVDSNLDWGQDLKGLAAWLVAHPGPRPKISYFGAAEPAYYGIDADFLPSEMRPMPERVVETVRRGDRLAISATNLQALYLPDEARPLMEILRTRRPLATIGHSIFLYEADFDWPPPPGSTTSR